jgi:8-oxo-dGTP diphosphatase
MDSEIAKTYGNKVRIRICGLCWDNERLLMVRHKLENNYLWAPPGGGLEFGESIEFALKREFMEETGLTIELQRFAFGCEFMKNQLHAVELFFNVIQRSGRLRQGYDPELQLIDKVQFLTPAEIQNLPPEVLHGIFRKCKDARDLRELNGFYTI